MHTPKPSEVAVGNVKVRIYCRVQRKMAKKGFKVYRTWQVADYSGGKRKLLAFADRDMARTKATEIATRLANMEGAVLTLKDDDRLSYVRALDVLKPTGIGIERAAAEFADAHGKLGGRSIAEAVNFFVQRNPTSLPRVSVADAVSRLLQAKRKDGMSEAYLADLGKRLNSFKKAFGCDLLIVSAPAINTWLRENWRGRNRNNFRGAVRTLYRFAVSAGFATKDTMDFEQIEVAKEHDYEIFTPSEMAKLLQAVQLNPEDLPNGYNKRHVGRTGLLTLLVLGGFAGMRTAEIQRQRWSDILLDRGVIRVTAAKGNTASKRLIPISDNLRAWLAVCGRDGELCCDYPRPWAALYRVIDRVNATQKKPGAPKLEWKHNALRHSYISYRVALTKSVAEVALESGNSPKMIHRHYRELVMETDAKTWFAIMPPDVSKIVPMPATAASG